MITSAINERMRRRLDYALEENRILKEAFRAVTGKERIPFTPDLSLAKPSSCPSGQAFPDRARASALRIRSGIGVW
jgi:hypothetical protein